MLLIPMKMRAVDLSITMAEMRAWLDTHKCEPKNFTHARQGNIVSVCIDFTDASAAEAFQTRFGGQPPASNPVIIDAAQSSLGCFRNDRRDIELPETMAQACWYRLMTEEVRAEASDFAPAAARETMEIAAQTWDQLAEHTERRLARTTSNLPELRRKNPMEKIRV
jgi:hypothetical protein